jgi:hypothetical protein
MTTSEQLQFLIAFAKGNQIALPRSVNMKEGRQIVQAWMLHWIGFEPWAEKTVAARKIPTWFEEFKSTFEPVLLMVPGIRAVHWVGFYRVKETGTSGPYWWAAKVDATTPWGGTLLELKIPPVRTWLKQSLPTHQLLA